MRAVGPNLALHISKIRAKGFVRLKQLLDLGSIASLSRRSLAINISFTGHALRSQFLILALRVLMNYEVMQHCELYPYLNRALLPINLTYA